MNDSAERLRILEMIESGRITAEEGIALLGSLNGCGDDPASELDSEFTEPIPAPFQIPLQTGPETHNRGSPEPVGSRSYSEPVYDPSQVPNFAGWRGWWVIPLLVGFGVTALSGILIYLAQRPTGFLNLWVLCASIPFILGLALMGIAWANRNAPWLHLRVQQPPGETPQRIALSFPLPVGLAAWFLSVFGRYIPHLKEQSLGPIITALGHGVGPENPIHIQVDEGNRGEKVEIYIG